MLGQMEIACLLLEDTDSFPELLYYFMFLVATWECSNMGWVGVWEVAKNEEFRLNRE
jgi:hypothetical protein